MTGQDERSAPSPARRSFRRVAAAFALVLAGVSGIFYWTLQKKAPVTAPDVEPPPAMTAPPAPLASPSLLPSGEAAAGQSDRTAVAAAVPADCRDLGPTEPRVALPSLAETPRAR